MLSWMLYVIVVTLLLSVAARAAEYAARMRRGRTRWIWALTIVASLAIPTIISSVSVQVPSLVTPTVSRKITALREMTAVQIAPLVWVRERTGNPATTPRLHQMLQRSWMVVSGALLAALVLNGSYVFWRKRRWRIGSVAGASVLIAPDVGPAVFGLVRPRIVVPLWLTNSSPSHQAMVIAHEQAHLAAGDPKLLTVALFLLVLMPWNLPLWWQLHRLRNAIEVDCDARVLEEGVDTRQYGEMLLEVSQRPSAYIGTVAAMSESKSLLEERIAIMVRDPAKWGSVGTVIFGTLALALVAVAAQVTPPNAGLSVPDRPILLTPAALDEYTGFYARGAHVVYSITRDGARLLLQTPDDDPIEIMADSEMNFFAPKWAGLGPVATFVRDRQGQITAMIQHYGTAFSVPLPRIDASTAQQITDNNKARFQSQSPAPGSEAALRRLFDGIRTGRPNYDEMAPWYAELVRETTDFNKTYARWGAVKSVEFRHVDFYGGDIYEVRQERGLSTWNIFLDSNGLIEDADNSHY